MSNPFDWCVLNSCGRVAVPTRRGANEPVRLVMFEDSAENAMQGAAPHAKVQRVPETSQEVRAES